MADRIIDAGAGAPIPPIDEAPGRLREDREAAERAIDIALAAEREAFAVANLQPLRSEGESLVPGPYREQAVFLLNCSAHPSALVAAALARAERSQHVANLLEESGNLGRGDQNAAFTLARMIEEVVDVLRVVLRHEGV